MQILEVAQWFADENSTLEAKRVPSAISTSSDVHIQEPHAVLVCKIKNKFALSQEELVCNTNFTHECSCRKAHFLMHLNIKLHIFALNPYFYMVFRASISQSAKSTRH